MAISNKLVNKKFIKDYTRERLWQLNKDDFKYLLNKHEIAFKKSASKDDLMQLLLDNKIDMWEVYKYGKCECFGMYAYDLEEMLNIDSKLRAKLQKKGILKVAYQNKSSYGGNSVVNFYDLECLYKMSKAEWEEYKVKYAIKPLTQKQLDAIVKREETLRKKAEEERRREQEKYEALERATTCDICDVPQMDYQYISYISGKIICRRCIERNEQIIAANRAIEDFFKPTYKDKEKYIIMDMETTDLVYNDICSMSVIDFNGNVLLDTVVRPNGLVTQGATYCHGITQEQANQGMSAQELYLIIRDLFIKYKNIIFYNVGPQTLAMYLNNAGIPSEIIQCNSKDIDESKIVMATGTEEFFEAAFEINSLYNHSIQSFVGGTADEFGLEKNCNKSLLDCFRIKKGIEKYAHEKPRELLF